MFGTDYEAGPNHVLLAWHSDDLCGPWTAHAANPIKIDVRSSRPAGTPFVFEGALYRPAQDCSRHYGGAVVLNRITRLTPFVFEEEGVCVLRPNGREPYRDGLHTLSQAGSKTLIDGCRRTFIWPAFSTAVRARLGLDRRS